MAKIKVLAPPPHLYRFRSLLNFRQEHEAIATPYLWFSPYKAMNDPMEGIYQPSRGLESREELIRREAYGRILDEKSNTGICSLSDSYNSDQMWAHYAGNFSGMCVEYRTPELLASLPETITLIRVQYGEFLPEITTREINDHASAAWRILSYKKSTWSYERPFENPLNG